MGMVAMLAMVMMASVNQQPIERSIRMDSAGVLRDRDGQEVALFGANYCLPSASDYRAAGYAGANRKLLIEQDLTHFARMGWDALRLSFWGDWECSDANGNLVVNDHLDLMCYTIAEASKRGLTMMLSPIVGYDSRWPEMREEPEVRGFSRFLEKSKWGTDPAVLSIQQNYLRQLLNHVNPYTGRAIKDEPFIPFIEMINEPWHHSEDRKGSVRYINGLVQAVRDTGCTMLTFHNLSQDFGMAEPIQASQVDGCTFGWYPSGLNANRTLKGNFLRYVDDYRPWNPVRLPSKARAVYEFDMGDVTSGTHFPAMIRAFRGIGAQFAAIFSYDMLATAPENLGWTTHLINLVYTPRKAASAVVAAEAMKRLPREKRYGSYPKNCRFGPVRIHPDTDTAELITRDQFLTSNSTSTRHPSPESLRRVVGVGSSPAVCYECSGMYFLDRIGPGIWRLEVYPDVAEVADPYHQPKRGEPKFWLLFREWPMTLRLPDLGEAFSVEPLNQGNSHRARAHAGTFHIRPGAYLLKARTATRMTLPRHVAGLDLREFVCPDPEPVPVIAKLAVPAEWSAGVRCPVRVHLVATDLPEELALQVAGATGTGRLALKRTRGDLYEAALPARLMELGRVSIEVSDRKEGSPPLARSELNVVAPDSPITLVSGMDQPFETSRDGELRAQESTNEVKSIHLLPGAHARSAPEDFTVSTTIADRLGARLRALRPSELAVKLRGRSVGQRLWLTLVDRDGSAWSASMHAPKDWSTQNLSLGEMRPSGWRMLPQGFPAISDRCPGGPRRQLDLSRIERLQLSIRRTREGEPAEGFGVEIATVQLR